MTPEVRHYTQLFRARESTRPILDCYWMARSHVHFLKTTKADLAKWRNRQRAAKRGWKKRRAASY
jgi:hypothetical protein